MVRWGSKSKQHRDTCLKGIGLRLQISITTLHSIVNTIARTYVSTSAINKDASHIIITKWGEVLFSTQILQTLHCRIANATRVLWVNLRVTSHMNQEPWPCNGKDPWLSSKGRTMGVGKAVLGSHGTSSIVWSENGPCCGPIAYFVGGKRGEDLVSYNMSQTLPIRENYLVVFIHIILPGLFFEICPEIRPQNLSYLEVGLT